MIKTIFRDLVIETNRDCVGITKKWRMDQGDLEPGCLASFDYEVSLLTDFPSKVGYSVVPWRQNSIVHSLHANNEKGRNPKILDISRGLIEM